MCQFKHQGKTLRLLSSRPQVKQPTQTPITPKKTKGIHLISAKDLDQELKNGAPFMILAVREVAEKTDNTIPLEPPWLKSLVMTFWKIYETNCY